MPTEFDTPMFWTDGEKEWLRGTSIQDRIGRQEAEQLYHDTIEPLVKVRPRLAKLINRLIPKSLSDLISRLTHSTCTAVAFYRDHSPWSRRYLSPILSRKRTL
jgi:hypothetical protein